MQRSMLKFLKWVLHHIDFNQAGYTGLMMDHCSPDIRNFHTLSDCFTKLNYIAGGGGRDSKGAVVGAGLRLARRAPLRY